jgi:phospholipid/cholesterol/gamma-HCH transport system substrate-binding protein
MKMTAKKVGLITLGLLAIVFVIAYQKERIVSVLSRGDMITADFDRQYKLEDYKSVVKLAGVRVGEVTSVDSEDGRGARVTMRIDRGIKEELGGEPSAAIRPALVVGGIYYVDLVPGGRGGVFNGHIPLERTTVPVELDAVLSAINPSAQRGLQGTVTHFDDALRQNGSTAIREFMHNTPPALKPTASVLDAFRGTRPDTDLNHLVSGLEGFSAVFNRKQGQFADILDSLDTSTAALNAERQPITETLATLPATLRTTRDGLGDLQGSLDRLTRTAPDFEDSAEALDPMLKKLGPVIHRARPVVSDLKDVLDDAEPMVHRLIPVADKGTEMFHDIRGPVLDRVNGPVKQAVLSPWHGQGVYANGGNDHPMYKEIAYLIANFDDTWKWHDENGVVGRIDATVNGDSATGGSQFPRTEEENLETLGLQKPNGPEDTSSKQKGLSQIERRKPINPGMKPVPAPGPFLGGGSDPLLMPLQGGGK